MNTTPDVIVAKQVITGIRDMNLLTETSLKDLEQKLSAGNISAEDWRLLAELNEEKKEGCDDCSN